MAAPTNFYHRYAPRNTEGSWRRTEDPPKRDSDRIVTSNADIPAVAMDRLAESRKQARSSYSDRTGTRTIVNSTARPYTAPQDSQKASYAAAAAPAATVANAALGSPSSRRNSIATYSVNVSNRITSPTTTRPSTAGSVSDNVSNRSSTPTSSSTASTRSNTPTPPPPASPATTPRGRSYASMLGSPKLAQNDIILFASPPTLTAHSGLRYVRCSSDSGSPSPLTLPSSARGKMAHAQAAVCRRTNIDNDIRSIYGASILNVRFSQTSVARTTRHNGNDSCPIGELQAAIKSREAIDPIHIVEMPDGQMTSYDNRRLYAYNIVLGELEENSRCAPIRVNEVALRYILHSYDDTNYEPSGNYGKRTWGETIHNRINDQSPHDTETVRRCPNGFLMKSVRLRGPAPQGNASRTTNGRSHDRFSN